MYCPLGDCDSESLFKLPTLDLTGVFADNGVVATATAAKEAGCVDVCQWCFGPTHDDMGLTHDLLPPCVLPVSCSVHGCSVRFATHEQLGAHMRAHHSRCTVPADSAFSAGKRKKQQQRETIVFRCPSCWLEVNNVRALVVHLRTHHLPVTDDLRAAELGRVTASGGGSLQLALLHRAQQVLRQQEMDQRHLPTSTTGRCPLPLPLTLRLEQHGKDDAVQQPVSDDYHEHGEPDDAHDEEESRTAPHPEPEPVNGADTHPRGFPQLLLPSCRRSLPKPKGSKKPVRITSAASSGTTPRAGGDIISSETTDGKTRRTKRKEEPLRFLCTACLKSFCRPTWAYKHKYGFPDTGLKPCPVLLELTRRARNASPPATTWHTVFEFDTLDRAQDCMFALRKTRHDVAAQQRVLEEFLQDKHGRRIEESWEALIGAAVPDERPRQQQPAWEEAAETQPMDVDHESVVA